MFRSFLRVKAKKRNVQGYLSFQKEQKKERRKISERPAITGVPFFSGAFDSCSRSLLAAREKICYKVATGEKYTPN